MFIGRAGLMAYYARKRFNIEKGRPKHQYLIDHQDTFKKLQHKNKNKYFLCIYGQEEHRNYILY